jgi:hypothetical protein
MVQTRSIAMFLSGVGFALVAMLSCKGHSPLTADADVADASPSDVAAPDGCCSSITVSGVTRTVSAENDASQLRSAVVTLVGGPQNGTLVSGPVVVTNIVQNFFDLVTIELYLSTGSCVNDVSSRKTFLKLGNSTTNFGDGLSGRLWIPAGTSLCFTTTDVPDGGNLLYSGFVPY